MLYEIGMYWISQRVEKVLVITLSIVYWVIALVLSNYLANLSTESQIEAARDDVRREVALVRSQIEATIFEHTYIADSLATVITLQPDFVAENWSSIGASLINKSELIRNVGMAPNNVISHVYPIEGNEKAIGLDFRTVPSQYLSVMRAKKLGRVFIDGPLKLVQGGTALIARFPIFLDFPENNNYWGSVSVVFQYDKILEKSGIRRIENAEVTLSRKSSDQKSVNVFYGEESTFESADFVLPIHLPNSDWTLSVQYRLDEGIGIKSSQRITLFFTFLGTLAIFISGLVLYRAYRIAHSISLKDELTGLPNRRFFMSFLQQRVKKSEKNGGFTLLNVDLNKFKAVNDNLGHDAGDALLQHVAKVLKEVLRSSDFIGRIGGDEFLIVLERCTETERVTKIILKIEAEFSCQPLYWKEKPIYASLSIGYAICLNDILSIKTLLAQADQSMYAVKHSLPIN